jgi:Icc-related predicted phosphoesterase
MLSKFRGWFLPKKYSHHYEHEYKNLHSAFVGNILGLRQPAHIISRPSKEKQIYLEKIVYVGCIHGGNNEIFERLASLEKYPPDYLIFAGDLTGTPEIEKLKNRFYDDKRDNPKSKYKEFTYFGNWAKTLPTHRRKELLKNLKSNAEKILSIIQKIKDKETTVLIIEGNWDNPTLSGINTLAGNDIKNVFDTRAYFKKHGLNFIDTVSTFSTETTFHIFLPFVSLMHFDQIEKNILLSINHKIKEARLQSKSVIMIGHAEANWLIHNLNHQSANMGKERQTVINNFGRAMSLFQPDEVIYPHQHNRIRDEKGRLIDLNAKYLLEAKNNGVKLIERPDLDALVAHDIIATYIPFGYLAEEDFVGIQ